ncbi:MAG: PIN domain-containing protein [Egibacteraceae bacterium]
MAERSAVDTNVLVAAHIADHEHHEVAADAAAAASDVLGQVTVETWSVLRRHFRLSADAVSAMLLAYVEDRQLVPPPVDAYRQVLRTGRSLALAGNVHDAVIVHTAKDAGLRLATLDAGLHRLADGMVPCDLLPAADES